MYLLEKNNAKEHYFMKGDARVYCKYLRKKYTS